MLARNSNQFKFWFRFTLLPYH